MRLIASLIAAALLALPGAAQAQLLPQALSFSDISLAQSFPEALAQALFDISLAQPLPQSQAQSLSGIAQSQTQSQSQATGALPATVAAAPTISGVAYQVTNTATYTKTATGLLVVLSPAALKGPGSLAGHTEGISMEIPDTLIKQLFF
jgi:hypothetical protein